MFTIRDLNKVLPELKGLKRKSPYSFTKSDICYKLSKYNSQFRGNSIEKMVRNGLLTKYITDYHGGNHSHDITLNRNVRIEVKSSLVLVKKSKRTNKISYEYNFRHVQLKKFDILVLAYVTPYGMKYRWMSQATAREFVNNPNKPSTITVNTNGRDLQGTLLNRLKLSNIKTKSIIKLCKQKT